MFLNRQFVSDTVVTLFYQPSSSVRAIEDRVAFTGDGKLIFFATQPEVLDADSFNERCPRQEVQNPILGCYVGDDRIYIYSITNEDLEGIEEVTAAHEMLHAAWKRLDTKQRKELEPELHRIYESMSDSELKQRMEYYERTQPGEFYNELHSIIGTEVEVVGEELDTYYARYFENRQAVIGFYYQYDAVFQELEDQTDSLYKQMQALGESIMAQRSEYDVKLASLSADINVFNSRADNGDFASEQAFYSERAQLMQRSNLLDADRRALNGDIDAYNDLRERYIIVAAQLERLDRSVDSFQAINSAPTLTQ